MNGRLFIRNQILIGDEAMRKLEKAKVVVVGIGAVGSMAIEALVRSGIGFIRVVDFDIIRESNFNRHIYADIQSLGKKKVDAAKERIGLINKDCVVETLPLFADEESYEVIFKGDMDVMIDAIDSVGPKTKLLVSAVNANIPTIISCMGAANHLDPFSIRVSSLKETRVCPLARRIRKNIGDSAILSKITCIYSEEPPQSQPIEDGEEEFYKRGRERKPLGSLMCITGMFGLLAARMAIKAICGK